MTAPFCKEAYTESNDVSADLVLTFEAGGVYRLNGSISKQSRAHFPPACVPAPDCEQFAAILGDAFPASVGVVCASAADDGCDCTIFRAADVDYEASWEVAGATLTMVAGDGSAIDWSYCVDNNQLWLEFAQGGFSYSEVYDWYEP